MIVIEKFDLVIEEENKRVVWKNGTFDIARYPTSPKTFARKGR